RRWVCSTRPSTRRRRSRCRPARPCCSTPTGWSRARPCPSTTGCANWPRSPALPTARSSSCATRSWASSCPARPSTTSRCWGPDWYLEGLSETARLLVSELVASAVLHARTGLELVMRQARDALRIEVHDSSARLPSRKHYAADAVTGRGLLLVETLAAGWGAE